MSVRIPDMPNLGAPTDDALFVADHLGSGIFTGAALRNFVFGAITDLTISGNLQAGFIHSVGDALVDVNFTVNGLIHGVGGALIEGSVQVGSLHSLGGVDVDGQLNVDTLIHSATAQIDGLAQVGGLHSVGGALIEGNVEVNNGVLHTDGGAAFDGDVNCASNLWVYGGTGHTIGTYGPDGYLIINGKEFSAGSAGASSLIINGGGRTPYCFEFYINGTRMIAFDGSGGAFKPGGGTWADISDARIKTDVTDYAAGLAEIIQLRPVSYRFVPETGRGTKVHYGLIAQEVETVMPEMVTQTSATVGDVEYSDMRSLDTQALIYALVSAVKELSTRVVALEGGAATRATVNA